jgi:hypothetical protein
MRSPESLVEPEGMSPDSRSISRFLTPAAGYTSQNRRTCLDSTSKLDFGPSGEHEGDSSPEVIAVSPSSTRKRAAYLAAARAFSLAKDREEERGKREE